MAHTHLRQNTSRTNPVRLSNYVLSEARNVRSNLQRFSETRVRPEYLAWLNRMLEKYGKPPIRVIVVTQLPKGRRLHASIAGSTHTLCGKSSNGSVPGRVTCKHCQREVSKEV